MTSIPIIPATRTPVYVTESRKVRADERLLEAEQTVDISAEAQKPSRNDGAALPTTNNVPDDNPIDATLSEVRPVIERLDGQKDVAGALKTEEPDQDDRALQANGAYQALREPDADLKPVGTI